MDDVRPVWLSREQRLLLSVHGFKNIVAAWDDAPADAAEAVTQALFECQHRIGERRTPKGAAAIRMGAVLRALGMPS